MKIKDIVNRDIVNLSNCEQEPIHIPGSIQGYGFLLALKRDDLVIDYCSGNIKEFIGAGHEQCLGKRFADIFGPGAEASLRAYLEQVQYAVKPPMELGLNGNTFLCTLHSSGDMYVAELEPLAAESPDINEVYNQTIQFVSYMERSETLQELCSKVADQTRAITGYDRVMIYRFDKDYNGEVFAESRAAHLEPFLGLHYPHTDIPAQARQLYLTNLMRIIADVNYKPIPIYTQDDAAGKTLDMSRSYLRSVSPIHIEYLQNMGVGGTLTISLIHDGRLWGLITCHHYSAKYVPLYSRIAAQMQGHFLTSQINVRQLNEEYKMAAAINGSLEVLLEQKQEADMASFRKIISNPDLLALCNAGGVALLFEEQVYTAGNTPGADDIRKLCTWLHKHKPKGAFSTSKLVEEYPEAAAYADVAAGIIYHSLSGIHNACIMWFAPETVQEVHWGGDPNNAIIKNEKGLSPRNSFELWKQIIKNESRPWRNAELLAATSFAHALQKHITLILITEEEQKQRLLTEQLRAANTELENINWISSHDLREPLRKIQIFSSKVMEREKEALSHTAMLSLQKMNKSAGKMQQLLSDITAYNKVRLAAGKLDPVQLDDVLAEVRDDLHEEITDKEATITTGKLPVISGVSFLLKQLFINLLRNSMKFAREGEKPVISINCVSDHATLPGEPLELYHIEVKDNGIGFSNDYTESIFKVFTRLHSFSEYEGSGIGLALCRKIMQNHKGYILASGQPGEGATFSLYFPHLRKE